MLEDESNSYSKSPPTRVNSPPSFANMRQCLGEEADEEDMEGSEDSPRLIKGVTPAAAVVTDRSYREQIIFGTT